MKVILVLSVLLVCLTLQTTMLSALGPFRPDVGVPFVLYLGLRHQIKSGALLSFLLGYLQDLFLGTTVGLHSFALILLFVSVRPTHDKIKIDGFWPVFFLGLLGAFGTFFVETLLRRIFLQDFPISGSYLGALALSAVSTAIVAPLIVWVVQNITGASSGRDEDRLSLR
jgi:rod shape-determining protein MreD